MAHEPSGFQRHAERAVKLVAADPLLAAAHEKGCLEPHMQRDVARLEYGSDAHRELLAAGVTLFQADALAAPFVLHAGQSARLADHAAMRANDSVRPNDRL
jgi:hypothetical protein